MADIETRASDVLPRQNLYYSAYVDPNRRFVYFANPKVGSTTILATLRALILNDPSQMAHVADDIHEKSRSPLKFLTEFDKKERNYLLSSPDIFRFCFVRHPFSRLLSAYYEKIQRNKHQKASVLRTLRRNADDQNTEISFSEFVNAVYRQPLSEMDFHWYPQHIQVYHRKIDMTFVGRMERFEEDFRAILQTVFGDRTRDLQVPQHNSPPPREAVDIAALPKSVHAKIWNKYYWDFEYFGYDRSAFEAGRPRPGDTKPGA
ncbi:MAG: sulfotransferase family protein [Kiloniellales bacterium]